MAQDFDMIAGSVGQIPPIENGRLLDFADDAIACMRGLRERHGELAALRDDGQQIVFAFGPHWNQRILSDAATFHSRFFAVRGGRRSAQRRVTSGLLSMNGPRHRTHRRMVMEPFQKRAVSGYGPYITQLAEEMLEEWQPGQVRDINADMTKFMLRLTTAILFGVDMPSMANELGEKVDVWTRMNHETGMGAFISDPVFVERYEQLQILADELEVSIMKLIETRRSTGRIGHDVLSLLLQAQSAGADLTDEELVGHVTLTFGAAHLTTAHTFTWTLFLLSQHPSIMRAVHDELIDTSQEDSESGDLIDRCLKESMRVLPASAYSQRICAEGVDLGPLKLGPGTPVIFSQFMTHHSPEIYSDADRFQPERWLSQSAGPYEFLPFGAGPRMCIGGLLAMTILKTVIPMVLKRYRLNMVAGAEINARVISTMLGPTTAVPMEVHEADGLYEQRPVAGNIHDLVELEPACHAEKPSHRSAA